jgi:hypothetical protein
MELSFRPRLYIAALRGGRRHAASSAISTFGTAIARGFATRP